MDKWKTNVENKASFIMSRDQEPKKVAYIGQPPLSTELAKKLALLGVSDLLPCPFCGSEPEIVHLAHPSGLPGIKCPHCHILMKEDRIDKTVGMWNRRDGNNR